MNKAFEMSTGDLVTYLNADDTFEAGIFAKVGAYFQQNPSCHFLVGNLQIVYPNQTLLRQPKTQLAEILVLAPYCWPQNPVSYFYRKQVQTTIGPFPLLNHLSMDYWFILRAYQQFTVHYLDQVFGQFHIHDANKSSNGDACHQSQLVDRQAFLQVYLPDWAAAIAQMPLDIPQPLNYLATKHQVPFEPQVLLLEKESLIQQQKTALAWKTRELSKHQQPIFLLRKAGNLLLTKFISFFSK